MDLVSHGLIGSMLAGLGIKKKLGLLTSLTMVIGSVAPDFDLITGIKGVKTFYKYHREVTHSFLGSLALTMLLTMGIYFFTPMKNFFLVLILVGGGLASHLIMDSFTPWGLPLFYPFSKKKYSFDLIWFFDPFIIGFLTGGFAAGYFIRDLEVVFSSLSFSLIAGYLIFRAVQRNKAKKLVQENMKTVYNKAKVSVVPSAVSPFLWDVILGYRSRYIYLSVDTRKKLIFNRQEIASSSYKKCVKCSQESDYVDVFLKRARFPFYEVVREEGCFTVHWGDVHLMNLGGVHGITVCVDDQGNIISEKLKVKKPVRKRRRKMQENLAQVS